MTIGSDGTASSGFTISATGSTIAGIGTSTTYNGSASNTSVRFGATTTTGGIIIGQSQTSGSLDIVTANRSNINASTGAINIGTGTATGVTGAVSEASGCLINIGTGTRTLYSSINIGTGNRDANSAINIGTGATNSGSVNILTGTYNTGKLVVGGDVSFNGNLSIGGTLINYYTKSAIDTSLNTNYATKTYVDNSLNANYALKTYVDSSLNNIRTQLNTLTNGAPQALDTLAEIVSAINSDASFGVVVYQKIASSDASINTLRSQIASISTVQDPSINQLFNKNTIYDSSFTYLQGYNAIQDTSLNTNYYTKSVIDASLNGIVSSGGNVSITNKLIVGSDISVNNGRLFINETTGTRIAANASTGTITLTHSDASGASSILFKSKNNAPSDFGYIQYEENIGGSGERGLLTIGIENDPGTENFGDRISLFAAGGNGFVGVNTKDPLYTLDISGNANVSNTLTTNKIEPTRNSP